MPGKPQRRERRSFVSKGSPTKAARDLRLHMYRQWCGENFIRIGNDYEAACKRLTASVLALYALLDEALVAAPRPFGIIKEERLGSSDIKNCVLDSCRIREMSRDQRKKTFKSIAGIASQLRGSISWILMGEHRVPCASMPIYLRDSASDHISCLLCFFCVSIARWVEQSMGNLKCINGASDLVQIVAQHSNLTFETDYDSFKAASYEILPPSPLRAQMGPSFVFEELRSMRLSTRQLYEKFRGLAIESVSVLYASYTLRRLERCDEFLRWCERVGCAELHVGHSLGLEWSDDLARVSGLFKNEMADMELKALNDENMESILPLEAKYWELLDVFVHNAERWVLSYRHWLPES